MREIDLGARDKSYCFFHAQHGQAKIMSKTDKSTLDQSTVAQDHPSNSFDVLFGSDDSEWDALFDVDKSSVNEPDKAKGSGSKPKCDMKFCTDSKDDELFTSYDCFAVLTQPQQTFLVVPSDLFGSDSGSECSPQEDKSACDLQPKGCSAAFDTLLGSDDSEFDALFDCSSNVSKFNVGKSDKGCDSSHSKTHAVGANDPTFQNKFCALFGDSEDEEEQLFTSNNCPDLVITQPLQHQQKSLASNGLFEPNSSECDPLFVSSLVADDKSSKPSQSKSKTDTDAILRELEDKELIESSCACDPQPPNTLSAKVDSHKGPSAAFDALFGSVDSEWDALFSNVGNKSDKPISRANHTLSDDAANDENNNSKSKADSLFGDLEDNVVVASSKQHQHQSSGLFDSAESECDAQFMGANVKSCADTSDTSILELNDDLSLELNENAEYSNEKTSSPKHSVVEQLAEIVFYGDKVDEFILPNLLPELKETLAENAIEVTLEPRQHGIYVCGTGVAINSAKQLINLMFDEVAIKTEEVEIEHTETHFIPVLESPEFKVLKADLKEELVDLTYMLPNKHRNLAQVVLLKYVSNVKVSVCCGEICSEDADAIVIPTHRDNLHTSLVSMKIITESGCKVSILDHWEEYTENCRITNEEVLCCVTDSGKLQCGALIHTSVVFNARQEEDVARSLKHALTIANKKKYKSVSVPLLSQGDLLQCANSSLIAVIEFCEETQLPSIQHIKFVLQNNKEVSAFLKVLNKSQCPSEPNYKWFWWNDSGYSEYDVLESFILTASYNKNPSTNVNLKIGRFSYVIDFKCMIQTNTSTGKERPVSQIFHHSSGNEPEVDLNGSHVQWYWENEYLIPFESTVNQEIEDMYQGKRSMGMLVSHDGPFFLDFIRMKVKIHDRKSLYRIVAHDENDPVLIKLKGLESRLTHSKSLVEAKIEEIYITKQIDFAFPESVFLLQDIGQHLNSQQQVKWQFDKALKVLSLEGYRNTVESTTVTIQSKIIQQIQVGYPPQWFEQEDMVETFCLSAGTLEFGRIERAFARMLPGVQISAIAQIQNKWLWERYSREKKRMQLKNSGKVNEIELYHGSSRTDPVHIVHSEEGFDFRRSKEQNLWGYANYFAADAVFSNNYAFVNKDGSRELLLAKVLTGDSCKLEPDSNLRMPPPNAGDTFMQTKYDSVKYYQSVSSNGVTVSSWIYMTYSNDKAYPAYLIKYHF